jgi:hypothetical protein
VWPSPERDPSVWLSVSLACLGPVWTDLAVTLADRPSGSGALHASASVAKFGLEELACAERYTLYQTNIYTYLKTVKQSRKYKTTLSRNNKTKRQTTTNNTHTTNHMLYEIEPYQTKTKIKFITKIIKHSYNTRHCTVKPRTARNRINEKLKHNTLIKHIWPKTQIHIQNTTFIHLNQSNKHLFSPFPFDHPNKQVPNRIRSIHNHTWMSSMWQLI